MLPMPNLSEKGKRRFLRSSPRIQRMLWASVGLLYLQTLFLAYNEGTMRNINSESEQVAVHMRCVLGTANSTTETLNVSGTGTGARFQRNHKSLLRPGLFKLNTTNMNSTISRRNITSKRMVNSKISTVIAMEKTGELTLGKQTRKPSWDINMFDNAPPLMFNTESFFTGKNDPLIYGNRRNSLGFLTIGIPSVSRPGTSRPYILDTLDSLIKQTTPEERKEVTLVVLLSDFNSTYNYNIAAVICTKYREECSTGFIHVLVVKQNVYPDFTKLRRTSSYNDSEERVKWRTKQNVDYAFLQLYCRNISMYYMQLEDDIETASDYIKDIKLFISNQKDYWYCLEFSRLGFIGKLFRSEELPRMALYLLLFHDQMPGDLLLNNLRSVMLQFKQKFSRQSLFQHIGKQSSLFNKTVALTDTKFKDRFSKLRKYAPLRAINGNSVVRKNKEQIRGFLGQRAIEIDHLRKRALEKDRQRLQVHSPGANRRVPLH